MKTFKIVTLQIIEDHHVRDIPLVDGLVVNKESGDGCWIIEAFVDRSHTPLFQEKKQRGEPFEIRVVITHAANDPAPFTATIINIREFKEQISVLFEGKLSRHRNQYPEVLLEDLIKEGYTGSELMEEFKKRMNSRKSS